MGCRSNDLAQRHRNWLFPSKVNASGLRITHERSNIVISWAFRSSHRRLKLLCLEDPPLRRAGSDKGVSERPRALYGS